MGLREKLALWLGGARLKASSQALPFVPSSRSGQPQWNNWSTDNAIRDGLKSSVWVYSCVRKIAAAVSSVPWRVQAQGRAGNWEHVPGHPLETLLLRPNPHIPGQDLMELVAAHLCLGGNAIWHVVAAGKLPVELWPIMPDKVQPIPHKTDWLAGYLYDTGEGKTLIKPDDVVHFQLLDPSNPYWGLSPMQAAARIIDTDVEAVKWNKVSLQNRAVSDGIFTFESPMTAEQWDSARRMIREQHQGSGNARTPWVLGSGARWQQMSLSPVEMDFLESRKFSREEICAVYGVPPVLLGSQDASTYNNISTAKRIFWEDTIIPFLEDLADAMNLSLAPYWDTQAGQPGASPKLRLRPDLSRVAALQESMQDRAAVAQVFVAMGVPFNMVNQRLELGFDPVPDGDLPRGQATVPTDQASGSKRRQIKSVYPEEEKTAFWKNFDAGRASWEERIATEVIGALEAEGASVVSAFKTGGLSGAFEAVDPGAWRELLEATYSATIEHFATLEGRRLEGEVKAFFGPQDVKKFQFDRTTALRKFIAKTVAEKIGQITDTTRSRIKTLVEAGIEAGDSTDSIARGLRDLYTRWAEPGDAKTSLARAYLIARTEVGAAANYGHQEGARQVGEQLGVTVIKEWVSSRDERVRDSHISIDGETASLDEAYSNGLMQPGDPGGPPEETIGCRCAEAHHVK